MNSIMARAKKVLESRKSKDAYAKMGSAEKKTAVSKIADLIRRRQSRTSSGERRAWDKNSSKSKTGTTKRRSISKVWSSNKSKTSNIRKNVNRLKDAATGKSTRDRVRNYRKNNSSSRSITTGGKDTRYGGKNMTHGKWPYTGNKKKK